MYRYLIITNTWTCLKCYAIRLYLLPQIPIGVLQAWIMLSRQSKRKGKLLRLDADKPKKVQRPLLVLNTLEYTTYKTEILQGEFFFQILNYRARKATAILYELSAILNSLHKCLP